MAARRLTAIRLTSPATYEPIAPLIYLRERKLLSLAPGDQWLLELTLDAGRQKQSKDLRPDLPVVVRY